ncbi:MAG: PAS domain-containing protein [Calditrichaeota bacterium]|nr:PAS domain-containing protein [Calditrichota bacterium]
MATLSEIIHGHVETLVESATETLMTSRWGVDLDLPSELYTKILGGIFAHLERDLRGESRQVPGYQLTKYYLREFQSNPRLKHNFHAQLAILGAARIVLNHFLVNTTLEMSDDFEEQFALLQRAFDTTLIFLSEWWGKVYQELRAKDHQLINELKIVKNDLQRQLDVIYQIIKEYPLGVADCDADLHVLHWNPMAARLTGFAPGDILKKNILELFHGQSREVFLREIRSERRRRHNLQLRIYRKGGDYFPAMVSIARLRQPSIGNVYYIISFQELGEQVRFASRIRQIDRLTAISRLTSAMMHDIRNPLNNIGLHVELLERLLESGPNGVNPEVSELTRKIQGQIQQLSDSLNHYLAYTHLADLNMVPVELVGLVDGWVQDAAYEAALRKVRVHFRRPSWSCWVMADWVQLRRVFANIFTNALQVLNGRGDVWITMRRRGKRVLVAIRDNGPGIESEHLKRVFEPFFTTKESGVGLGLFVSREIVAAHGGRITCSSKVGQGALFSVSLPQVEQGEVTSE